MKKFWDRHGDGIETLICWGIFFYVALFAGR